MNSVDMTMTQEEAAEATVMETMINVTKKIREAERFELASRLLKKAQDPEQFMISLNRILRGSLLDNAILGFSAVAGISMGTIFGRLTRGVKSIGPVPAIALLGLLGVIPGALMNETVTVRNTLSLGGLMFSAGALLQKLLVP
jgi:xanthosine utilization system XapX-like protein